MKLEGRGFDPREFFKLVEEAINSINKGDSKCVLSITEGLYRTIVSRAYYSLFLRIRKALIRKDMKKLMKRQRSIHILVIKRLRKLGYNDIAELLNELRQRRTEADYDLTKHVDRRTAIYSYNLAKKLHELIDKARLDP